MCIYSSCRYDYLWNKRLRASDTFYQGLKFKVEETADKNKDGTLNIEELVSVLNIININPDKRLHDLGFFLMEREMQQYLKAMGNYDSNTDSTYNVFGEDHPYFTKAVAEGKQVHGVQL